MVVFLIGFGIVVGGYLIRERYIEWKLSTFDLDGNGIFTENEQTKEQMKWFSLQMNDAGDLYLFSFAGVLSFCSGFIGVGVYMVIHWLGLRKTNLKKNN